MNGELNIILYLNQSLSFSVLTVICNIRLDEPEISLKILLQRPTKSVKKLFCHVEM